MAWTQVTGYALGFNIAKKQSSSYFTLADHNKVTQIFLDAAQQATIADMFRNEGPIFFNNEGDYFVTDSELVGEGE